MNSLMKTSFYVCFYCVALKMKIYLIYEIFNLKPTKGTLSLPQLDREYKIQQKLVGQDKDKERSLSHYRHGENYCQSNQNRVIKNKLNS